MTEPGKYRSKPVEIEAMRWDGTAGGATPIIDWLNSHQGASASYVCSDTNRCIEFGGDCPHWIQFYSHGIHSPGLASLGQWVVKDEFGEFFAMKHETFTGIYEPAE